MATSNAILITSFLVRPNMVWLGMAQQHHITDGLAACYRGNTDHMAKLSRAKGGGMTGSRFWMVVHGGSLCLVPVIGGGLREKEKGLLVIIPAGPKQCSRKVAHAQFWAKTWLGVEVRHLFVEPNTPAGKRSAAGPLQPFLVAGEPVAIEQVVPASCR